MHPVEHLYYFACILPSLVFRCSPYAFLWNGVHLLMSPAASHSGWEDHMQSDAFHYMHHRYFECNYAGTDAGFMDVIFGTFRGSMDEVKPRADAKSTLRAVPTSEFLVYLGLSYSCFALWYQFVNNVATTKYQAVFLSLLTGFGPTILSVFVSRAFGGGSRIAPAKMSVFGNTFHLVIGSLFCAVPVSYTSYLALKNV